MLTQLIADFIDYTEQVNFKAKSRETVTSRLKQLAAYCESHNIQDVNEVTFQHLLAFVADFGYCSVLVKKSKIWALHQFFHFLSLKKIIPENIASQLPYPKVGKKDPMFLTTEEFNRILQHFVQKANKPAGLRNLIIIMLLGIMGLRLSSIVQMDVDDVDLKNKTIRIVEKGSTSKRLLPLRKGNVNRRKAIDTDTAERLLKAVDPSTWPGLRDFMILSCLWALGMRRQEAAALTRGCFEPEIVIQQKIGLLRVPGKGNKQRSLFVVDLLDDFFIRYLNHPKTSTENDDPMFRSKTGTFMHGDAIGKIVRRIAEQAGIKQRITPHMLRHGFATDMYMPGVPPEALQAMMGHDHLEETARYIHIPMQNKQQALEQLTINGENYDF